MRKYASFCKSLSSGELARCYAFLGDEDLLKEQCEAILADRLRDESGGDLDRLVFFAKETGRGDVEAAVSYSSLFGASRLVVLDGLEGWSSSEQRKFLDFLDRSGPAAGTVLLLKSRARKLPVSVGGMVSHVFWKFFERDLLKWTAATLEKWGVAFQSDVPRILVERYAGEDVKSLRPLYRELEKLRLFAGAGETVSSEMISSVCSAPPQAEWFRFMDAVCGRRIKEALGLARTFFEANPAGTVGFFNVLAGRLTELLMIRLVADEFPRVWREIVALCRRRCSPRLRRAERAALDKNLGESLKALQERLPGRVSAELGAMRAWTFALRCLEADRFSARELKAALSLAVEAEGALKSGRGFPLAELDLLVTRICVPGLLVTNLDQVVDGA